MIGCSAFPKARCCGSCHDDEFEFGYDLCELYEGDITDGPLGRFIGSICCRVNSWLGEQPDKKELLQKAWWESRVSDLVKYRKLSRNAAEKVINAAMFGKGCIPEQYRKELAAQVV